jgi:lipid-binding SYLF domain-containing protein
MNKTIILLTLSASIIMFCGCGPSTQKYTLTERQQIIDEMANNTIQRLYQEEPSAKQQIDNSKGYGVFSNANVNIIFASFGGGYGVVVDKEGHKTYMKMGLGGIGLGIGVKDYRQVLIYQDSNTLQSFVDKGWEFGGHADAAAKAGQTGGELSGEGDIDDDIIVYSMTETGLALQATVTGAKYWKSSDLN